MVVFFMSTIIYKDKDDNKSNKRIVVIAIVIVLVLWGGSWWLVDAIVPKEADRGSFGDKFGAVNALFTGLAFAGVIITIYLQSKELKLQREELEQTREELRGQKEALQLQNETLTIQQFENKFFQLISMHNEIVDSITHFDNSLKVSYKGSMAIAEYYKDFRGKTYLAARSRLKQENPTQYPDDRTIINEAMNSFMRGSADLSHYFRNLYHIVKFINKSNVSDKKFYSGILRSKLSAKELCFLFYNCMSDIGSDKFKPLVIKYDLLKNMPQEDLIGGHAKYHSEFRPTPPAVAPT